MKKILLVLIGFSFFTSCVGGGAKGELYFEEAIYPVFASSGTFYDESGRLAEQEDYEVVGSFRKNFSAVAFVWGIANLKNHIEIGKDINDQVAKVGGDAVHNLEISISSNLLNWTPVLSILPFWPTLASGFVKGEIIRYKNKLKVSSL
jgi:hypothetical protein